MMVISCRIVNFLDKYLLYSAFYEDAWSNWSGAVLEVGLFLGEDGMSRDIVMGAICVEVASLAN